jgi:hypothetical protein
VTGGGSDTAVWATWSDWVNGYQGDFAAYSKTTISLATIMSTLFPDGLCSVGNVHDYIDIAGGNAYQWIDIMENTAENMAVAEASGRPFTYDETDIYLTRASADVTALSGVLDINGSYTVNGHGLEMFEGSTVPVGAWTRYGVDLRNKLERDVLTISQQTLTDDQKKQARDNIGAIGGSDFASLLGQNFLVENVSVASQQSLESNKFATYEKTVSKSGYVPIGLVGHTYSGAGSTAVISCRAYMSGNTIKLSVRNIGGNTATVTAVAVVLWMKV